MALYLACAAGVAVSVLLPIIRPLLPKPLGPADKSDIWDIVRPYLITAIFSLIVALVLVAFLGETIETWQAAFLAGYTADSTLQKITTGNQ
jgi:hypothetical protein